MAKHVQPLTLSNDTGPRKESPYATMPSHFFDAMQAFLARRPSDFAQEIRNFSSGGCAVVLTDPRHSVRQFQIGGEHVAR